MPTIDIRHTQLDYTEQGQGEPLVLVHGSASDQRTWAGQLGALARHYRVLAYSRRYHWPNATIPAGADYAMAEQLDDLQTLIQSLKATPAHLVGHSYGAFLALLLALRAPRLVRSLVLSEPPVITLFVSQPPRPLELIELLATRPRTAMALLKFAATGMAPARAAARRGDLAAAMQVFGRAVLGPEAYAALSAARREQVRANTLAAEFLGSGFLPLQADALRELHTPTLLVRGERSPALFRRLEEALAELLPRAQRMQVAGASHLVHEDNPQAFNHGVLSFLAEHAAPRP